jgi:hypothetical protein
MDLIPKFTKLVEIKVMGQSGENDRTGQSKPIQPFAMMTVFLAKTGS